VLLQSVVAALVATVAEGLSPAGTDNLTVPILTAGVLYLFAS
jgi:phytol kinase